MATNELRKRLNWQTQSQIKALATEDLFCTVLQKVLDDDYPESFFVEPHPKEFGDIYSTYILDDETLSKIYNIDVSQKNKNGTPKYKWGISMDFAIRNKLNGKILFGEIKRQDGWIETTDMQAG
ncbi:MunI family type II restriction endonuclease [Streptococcus suis]